MIEKGSKIELGCGPGGAREGFIGIDRLPGPNVDIVGDALDVAREIPDGNVSEIYCRHFLEHVADLPALLRECARVLEPGGTFRIIVPHFSNPYYYSDPTHKNFFGLYSFDYLAGSSLFRRPIPTYAMVPEFECESVKIAFGSFRPYYIRHAFKKVFQLIFNSTKYLQEFYEENLCWIVPCYEIDYVIRKRRGTLSSHSEV